MHCQNGLTVAAGTEKRVTAEADGTRCQAAEVTSSRSLCGDLEEQQVAHLARLKWIPLRNLGSISCGLSKSSDLCTIKSKARHVRSAPFSLDARGKRDDAHAKGKRPQPLWWTGVS